MNMETSRRQFLKSSASAAAGLVIAVNLPLAARAQSGAATVMAGSSDAGFAPNAFIHIAPDNTVTVMIKHIEFGQGPSTGLTTLVAEELDADWSQMRAEMAPADDAKYANLAFGVQGTGGSTAMANSFMQMRQAGAAARAMLVAAAAKRWNVSAEEITVAKGVVSAGDKSATFGALAADAAKEEVPAEPKLKDPSKFTLIGTDVHRLDTPDKTTGKQVFTLDLYPEGLVTAVIAHPPQFGGVAASVDDADARAVNGVIDVKIVPQGVAVYAQNTFAALKGRDALKITWDDSKAEKRSSTELEADYMKAATSHGATVRNDGDVAKALEGAAVHEADYFFPFLAHAPMETLDAVIHAKDGKVTSWHGAQFPTGDKKAIAAVYGVDESNVTVNTMFAGGSFGRRAQPQADFAVEAASVAKALGGDKPVKLMWTRENDIRGGRYRPLAVHRLRGAIGADGQITGWDQQIAVQSFIVDSAFAFLVKNGVDPIAIEGANDMPYKMASQRVGLHMMQNGVPTLWWRSVGHTHTAYAVETFLDELLEKAGKDGVEGRLALLMDDRIRDRAVLEKVAGMAEASGAVPAGRKRGVALHKSFNTYVAEIAEVSEEDGFPRVHKVWCAVDCGVPVNPNLIRAQMEGGIGYGLGAILFDAITLGKGGSVVESNFDSYRSIRINEMPEIEVAVINSAEAPTGVGEPGTPPIGPAVANAWRRLTGKAVHRLPFIEETST